MKERSLFELSAMQTMAGKAIRDIKSGGRRETRNVLELCRSYAQRPQQQEFWGMIKLFLTSSQNRYQALLHRTARSVKESSLKTLAINLSCTSFADGGDILRRECQNGKEISWLQWLSPCEDPQAAICAWAQKGVSFFLIDAAAYKQHPTQLAQLPGYNSRGIFIYILEKDCADFSWVSKAAAYENVCFLLSSALLDALAPQMQKKQLLFGVVRSYSDVETPQKEQELLHRFIGYGCLLAVYRSALQPDTPTVKREEAFYRLLKQARCKGQAEIFVCDLKRDAATVQDLLLERQKISEWHCFSG